MKKEIYWIRFDETGEKANICVDVPNELIVGAFGLVIAAGLGMIALVSNAYIKGAEALFKEENKQMDKLGILRPGE